MSSGFLKYAPKHLAKINSIRRAKSQPDILTVPTLNKGQVLFVPESQDNGTPASCYACNLFNYEKSCQIIGPKVKIKKFVYGEPDKPIEYWPCCSDQDYGEPNFGPERFAEHLNDPTNLGLIWINAPAVGLEYGGANCGGQNGGDDCDYYMTDVDDKRAADVGFCRVLQSTVGNKEKCAAWIDDDLVTWQEAQSILRKLNENK